jgi:hypothetical protein
MTAEIELTLHVAQLISRHKQYFTLVSHDTVRVDGSPYWLHFFLDREKYPGRMLFRRTPLDQPPDGKIDGAFNLNAPNLAEQLDALIDLERERATREGGDA